MNAQRSDNTVIGLIKTTIQSLSVVPSFLLGAMVLIVVANVVGRFLFKLPVFGTIELVELMMIIICFLAIPYTAMNRGQVRIDFLVNRMPKKAQRILGSIAAILSVGIFAIITYQAAVNTVYYTKHLYQCTDTLEIPFAPFKAVMLIGFLLLVCIEFIHIFRPLPPETDATERLK